MLAHIAWAIKPGQLYSVPADSVPVLAMQAALSSVAKPRRPRRCARRIVADLDEDVDASGKSTSSDERAFFKANAYCIGFE